MTAAGDLLTGVPPFRLLFPAGWVRHEVDESSERELLARSREKFKRMHRPELDLELTMLVKSSFRQMRTKDVFALYLPTDVREDGLVPMSITGSVLRDPAGGSLDSHIAHLFRTQGAVFLDERRSTVRWEREYKRLSNLPDATNLQINYAVSVPGTGRRQALLFTTSIVGSASEPFDDDTLDALRTMSDVIIGTFSWQRS